ncbi:hypothetical protein BBJ28_00004515 [Nothophytophthora sp. Chile5]|nr:hypothetical protein BBJ28_00004515 [Nothophytophthora sp. Chile5]
MVTCSLCSFQGLTTNKTVAVAACLRACQPSSPAFQSAVERGFYDLAAVEAASSSIAGSVDGTPQPRKVKAGVAATITEAQFSQLLRQLSTDFPKSLQSRLIQTLLSPSGQAVGLARFQRAVQVCLLLEELVDSATALFQALEASGPDAAGRGEVAVDALATALQSAATSQFPSDATAILLPLLTRAPALQGATTPSLSPQTSVSLQLNDVYNLLLDLAFQS